MSESDVYPLPYSERAPGFAVQAVTHWLRLVPGRVRMGLKAGGLTVALPERPAGVSHRGVEIRQEGYVTACDDVSSVWLREHPDVTDRYLVALREVLKGSRVHRDHLQAYALFAMRGGSVELHVGSRMDLVDLELDDDAAYPRMMTLLRDAPRGERVAFAMPPEPGQGAYDDPFFLAGEQAWLEGDRVLIEYLPDDGGHAETVALDRDALADAIEKAWYAMTDVADRMRAGLVGLV